MARLGELWRHPCGKSQAVGQRDGREGGAGGREGGAEGEQRVGASAGLRAPSPAACQEQRLGRRGGDAPRRKHQNPSLLLSLSCFYHCADGPERNSSLRLGSQCRTSSNQLQVSEPAQGQHEHPNISHWFSQGRSPCLAAAPSRVPRQAVIPLGHCGHQSQQPQLHCLRRHRNILLLHKAPQGHNQMEGTKHLSFLLQPSHRSERMLW